MLGLLIGGDRDGVLRLEKIGISGEEHTEGRAGAGTGFEADRSAVIINEFGNDCETQANALSFRRKKWIEYLLAKFGRHAGTSILDQDDDARKSSGEFRCGAEVQNSFAIAGRFGHGLESIEDQVDENLLAELLIGHDFRNLYGIIALDFHAGGRELLRDNSEGMVEDLRDLNRSEFKALRTSEVEKASDKRVQAIHFR